MESLVRKTAVGQTAALTFLGLFLFGAFAAAEDALPTVELRRVPRVEWDEAVDCNLASYWANDEFHLFVSHAFPLKKSGKDVLHLGPAQKVEMDNALDGGRWIEAAVRADDGTVYCWYHHEPANICPQRKGLTEPIIGAFKSTDNCATVRDLGFVLQAPKDSRRCDVQNMYFAGGHGDFSCILDRKQEFLYLFYTNYSGSVKAQGVSVARMAWKDRDLPAGRFYKWRGGKFVEPGLGGAGDAIFPATIDWARKDCDSFWGPSVHWNTYLKRYVMMLNRSKPNWKQEGIYISFNEDLSRVDRWSAPQKIMDGPSAEDHRRTFTDKAMPVRLKTYGRKYYPAVIGDLSIKGTDKLAGRISRFFIAGVSDHEILFTRAGDEPPPATADAARP
jgi:hypothetical protein